MNWFARFLRPSASAGASSSVSDESGWFVRLLGFGKTKAGVTVSHYNAITMPAVWACITLIADTISQLPLDLYKRTGRRKELITDHPIVPLLSGLANPRMGTSRWINTQQGHVLGWGNGYAEIQISNRGEPIAIWPLLPDRTAPDTTWLDERGAMRYLVTVEGKQHSVPSDRIIHIKGFSWDGILGLSPISQARHAIGLGLAMEEFGSKFFSNDAKSGGFLLHPGKLSPRAKENIRDSLTEAGGGLEDAHRIKILEEGMKYIPTTINPEDSQFLESREFQIAEIARMFRVPLVLINSHQKDTAWGTGIEQLMIGFVQWTIGPWVKCWEEELNRKLLTEEERDNGFFIKFNLNAILRGDMAARASFYEKALDPEKGWMTRDEVREKEDLNPLGESQRPVLPEDDDAQV